MFSGCNISGVISLKYVSINNQECKIRSEIININSNQHLFCPYSIKINKCSGTCNILMIHIQACVFLMLLKIKCQSIWYNVRNYEARHIKWHETC